MDIIELLQLKLSENALNKAKIEDDIVKLNQKLKDGLMDVNLDDDSKKSIESQIQQLEEDLVYVNKEIQYLKDDLVEEESKNNNKRSDVKMDKVLVQGFQALVGRQEVTPETGITKKDNKVIYDAQVFDVSTAGDLEDLSKFFTVKSTNKGLVKERAKTDLSQAFPTVAELEKNPSLAKVKYTDSDVKIETRRGVLGVSIEAIEDADVNLEADLREELRETTLATKNKIILDEINKLDKTELTDIETLRNALLTGVAKKWAPVAIVTQSAYVDLTGAKYEDCPYVFNSIPTGESDDLFFGRKVYVVDDELLGDAGNKTLVLTGKKALTLYIRKQFEAELVNHDIYGKVFYGGIRAGVSTTYPDAIKVYTVNFTQK